MPRRACVVFALSMIAVTGVAAVPALAADPRHVAVSLDPVAGMTFVQPTVVTNAGDERLFVAERRGYVYAVSGGVRQSSPYLDLHRIIGAVGAEQGLLGVAFAPQFAKSRLLYVAYTSRDGSLQVTRLRASTADATVVKASTRVPILTIPAATEIDVGGALGFGPDGMLYIGAGDGGAPQSAQSLHSLSGKILRIDVSKSCGATPYCIPEGNPFATRRGARPEIWHLGLRNPRKFSFDHATGGMWIGDAGQESHQEIDTVGTDVSGRNFGWPCRDARHASTGLCRAGPLTAPVDELSRSDGSCGVIGGAVYRGSQSPQLAGMYLFTDACGGRIWGRVRIGGGRWVRSQVGFYSGTISAFGASSSGELYAVDQAKGLLLAVRGGASGKVHTAGSPVAQENQRPGTRAWYPLQPTGPAGAIEGYTSDVSVAPGQPLEFHVSAAHADSYQVMIFRLGYYRGLGGRLVGCLPSCSVSAVGQKQPVVPPDPVTGAAAQNWPVTDSRVVPASWVSGYYVAKLTLTDGADAGSAAPVPFIVRQDAAAQPSRMLVVSASNTEQAYNAWGGKSVYGFNSTSHVAATAVSFDRPYAGGVLFFESRFVEFIESQPTLDVAYVADLDVDRNPQDLLRHRFTLVNGHSEYWSKGMRDAYENARDSGVNLAFWGADQGDWQVRYADNGRTMISYKHSADPDPDPTQQTTNFSKLPVPRPQCQLLGTSYKGGMDGVGSYAVSAAEINDRFFAGTGFIAGDTFAGNGFEYDDVAETGCLPYPTTVFFADNLRPDEAPAVRYTAASGATVVTIGSEALAFLHHDPVHEAGLRRFALNVLTDLNTYRPQ